MKGMKNKILWLLSIIPLPVTAFVLPAFPDKVPMHYDISGNIDRWGSKNEQFIFPVIILLMTLFWQFFISYFKRRQLRAKDEKGLTEAKKNLSVIYVTAYSTTLMFSIMHYAFLYSAWIEIANHNSSKAIDTLRITFLLLGVFLLTIGLFMPRTSRNSPVGLRTPWSQKNDRTWAASQRAGAIVLMISGVLMIIFSLFLRGTILTIVCIGLIFLSVVIAAICSFLASRKYQ